MILVEIPRVVFSETLITHKPEIVNKLPTKQVNNYKIKVSIVHHVRCQLSSLSRSCGLWLLSLIPATLIRPHILIVLMLKKLSSVAIQLPLKADKHRIATYFRMNIFYSQLWNTRNEDVTSYVIHFRRTFGLV